jgi:hypothetical protein
MSKPERYAAISGAVSPDAGCCRHIGGGALCVNLPKKPVTDRYLGISKRQATMREFERMTTIRAKR